MTKREHDMETKHDWGSDSMGSDEWHNYREWRGHAYRPRYSRPAPDSLARLAKMRRQTPERWRNIMLHKHRRRLGA